MFYEKFDDEGDNPSIYIAERDNRLSHGPQPLTTANVLKIPFFQLTQPLGHVSYCHHFSSVIRWFGLSTKMAPTAELSLTQDPMGNSCKNLLVWNQLLNQNQTLMEQSLDGPLPKMCPAVALSHQDGHHSAVALLLKAALIQVSDYRFLGASGFSTVPQLYFLKPVILLLSSTK